MANRRRGLGKGLGALIPQEPASTSRPGGPAERVDRPADVFFGGTGSKPGLTSTGQADLVEVPGAYFATVAVAKIKPNRHQPRQVFDSDELDELAASIKAVGLLQPIVVRPLAKDRYELVVGERRWRAAQRLGLAEIPAIVRQTDDGDMLRDALLENLHRAELNPLEEAAAYQQLMDDFGCTQEELAGRLARSRPQITNTLRLLKLPSLVQRRLAAGVLSAGHGRALLGLEDAAAMERLAQKIVAEGLSVRSTEQMVAVGDIPPPKAKSRASSRAGSRTEALDELQDKLIDHLDTNVKITLGKAKGRITIEFASVQDLDRILGLIAPDQPRLRPGGW
ncbi:MAG: ParB/RepB/Spo0J family partition protein [Micrococcales bacterium]|nr:ParB/RepB/Spo0J family partition protein [Micrococcales bacterium]